MTKRKLTITIVCSIVAVILITVAICAIIANSKNDKTLPEPSLANWQRMIKNDALVKNVVTPGAHDAGTIGLPYFAATQDKDISMLLLCGTRYFDLRVAYDKGNCRIYHGPSKGIALESVLDDVQEFIKTYPSEFVILDFQHFDEKDGEAQQGAIALVEQKLSGLLIVNDTSLTDVEFTNNLTLEKARGKFLITWGRETQSILSKNYVFKRNNDDGTRKDSTIHSYYEGALNKKSSRAYIKNALPTYIEKYKSENKGLFVLQGQLTDGLFVFGPRFREATHTDNMDEYVRNLKDSKDLPTINIIMRDFVSAKKNCFALELNLAKDLVREDCITEFNTMLQENYASEKHI